MEESSVKTKDVDNRSFLDVELDALQSIYMNEIDVNKTNQLTVVSIDLHPATADKLHEQYVKMTLKLTIQKEYPEVIPDIDIRNPRGLSEEKLTSIAKDLKNIAESKIRNSMLFELIEAAKDHLTAENRPCEECAICLYGFHDDDVFTKTECYHYFHSYCLACYSKSFSLSANESDCEEDAIKNEANKLFCPVCRLSIHFKESEKIFPPPIKGNEKFEITDAILELQKDMRQLYLKQEEKGGIINLEDEKNKYLLEISHVTTNVDAAPETKVEDLNPSTKDEVRSKSSSPKSGELAKSEVKRERKFAGINDRRHRNGTYENEGGNNKGKYVKNEMNRRYNRGNYGRSDEMYGRRKYDDKKIDRFDNHLRNDKFDTNEQSKEHENVNRFKKQEENKNDEVDGERKNRYDSDRRNRYDYDRRNRYESDRRNRYESDRRYTYGRENRYVGDKREMRSNDYGRRNNRYSDRNDGKGVFKEQVDDEENKHIADRRSNIIDDEEKSNNYASDRPIDKHSDYKANNGYSDKSNFRNDSQRYYDGGRKNYRYNNNSKNYKYKGTRNNDHYSYEKNNEFNMDRRNKTIENNCKEDETVKCENNEDSEHISNSNNKRQRNKVSMSSDIEETKLVPYIDEEESTANNKNLSEISGTKKTNEDRKITETVSVTEHKQRSNASNTSFHKNKFLGKNSRVQSAYDENYSKHNFRSNSNSNYSNYRRYNVPNRDFKYSDYYAHKRRAQNPENRDVSNSEISHEQDIFNDGTDKVITNELDIKTAGSVENVNKEVVDCSEQRYFKKDSRSRANPLFYEKRVPHKRFNSYKNHEEETSEHEKRFSNFNQNFRESNSSKKYSSARNDKNNVSETSNDYQSKMTKEPVHSSQSVNDQDQNGLQENDMKPTESVVTAPDEKPSQISSKNSEIETSVPTSNFLPPMSSVGPPPGFQNPIKKIVYGLAAANPPPGFHRS